MRSENAQSYLNFELGGENGSTMPIYSIIGFQQTSRLDSQERPNWPFFQSTTLNAHCIIGTEKYPDVGVNCDYMNDKYSQAYGEIVFLFWKFN